MRTLLANPLAWSVKEDREISFCDKGEGDQVFEWKCFRSDHDNKVSAIDRDC